MNGLLEKLPGVDKRDGWPWRVETDPSVYELNLIWPKISIVTPSLNQGELIEETIRSILLQNYPNFEYIIIDGGSSDNTLAVIRKYQPWITHWISEADNGQSEAINKGLKISTGSIFNWINADDLLAPGALEAVGRAFMNTGCSALCGYTKIFNHATRQEERSVRMWIGQNAEETFIYPDFYYQGIFFLKDIISNLGGVNPTLHYMMDFELWRKFIANSGINRVALIDDVLGMYRDHEQSKTSTKTNYFVQEILMIDVYISKIFKFPSFYSDYINNKITVANYYQTQEWKVGHHFKVSKVKLIILKKYLYQLYFDGEIDKCRKQLLQLVRNDLFLIDWRMMVLFIKVVILGRSLDRTFQKMLRYLR